MPRCPGCGESVSQFAAGCAICGYDLELSPRGRTKLRAPQVRLRSPLRIDQEVTLLIVIALLTLGIPLVGIAAAIYQLSHDIQRPPVRRALWLVLGLGALMLVSPHVRYGVWHVMFTR
jgi:succinate dehydrogenase hydrophobic anchor subunit